MLVCVPCTQEHIDQLKPNIRPSDVRELEIAMGIPAAQGLQESFEFSKESFTCLEGDRVVCIYGVTPHPLNDRWGVPWMICAEGLTRNGKQFAKHCREKVAGMLAHFDLLTNIVPVDHDVAISWLRWSGFTFLETVKHNGHDFIQFIKYNKPCVIQ